MDGRISIQILHVPDCPLVGRVRQTVREVLARIQVRADVVELVGDYPSPTLLVNGRDVTGNAVGARSACRLDLPTEQQVLTALERLTTVCRTERPPASPAEGNR